MSEFISTEEQKHLIEDKKWVLYLIGCTKPEDQTDKTDHIAEAKNFVLQHGGKLVEDIKILHGFSAVFPPDGTSFSVTAAANGHIEFAEPDGTVTTQG